MTTTTDAAAVRETAQVVQLHKEPPDGEAMEGSGDGGLPPGPYVIAWYFEAKPSEQLIAVGNGGNTHHIFEAAEVLRSMSDRVREKHREGMYRSPVYGDKQVAIGPHTLEGDDVVMLVTFDEDGWSDVTFPCRHPNAAQLNEGAQVLRAMAVAEVAGKMQERIRQQQEANQLAAKLQQEAQDRILGRRPRT